MFFYCLLSVVIFLISLDFLFNYNEKARLMRKVPGPSNLFLVGNALDFLITPVKLFGYVRRSTTKWKRLFRFYSFGIGAINIYTPDDIEMILSSSKHNDKSALYEFLKPWLRDGLLVSNGSKWQNRRKILTPAFHFNILQKFSVILEENSRKLVETLELKAGQVVDVVPVLSEFTLNSICETAMGTCLSEESSVSQSYKSAIYDLGKIIVQRITRILWHSDLLYNMTNESRKQKQCIKTIHDFTRNVVNKRKDYVKKHGYKDFNNLNEDDIFMNNGSKVRTAMLDLLILAQKDNLIDDVGIQEEVDTFMFEGHDTTAAGLTYCLMLLSMHSDVQEKIYEELKNIFGDSDRSATHEDIGRMKYLDCCIKESLRLYPPVPFISRQLTENITFGDYTIPKGVYCHIHIYDLHRNKDLFPNPLQFDPDRFLLENCVGRHPFAYIPFSAGPRNCIGQRFAMMEMKLAVSAILRRFQLTAVTYPWDIEMAADLVLRNTKPVQVVFKKRNK